MKALLALLLLIPSAEAATSAGARFKGYVAVENVLTERLLQDGKYFTFQSYLYKEDNYQTVISLLQLMGAHNAAGNNEFRNGSPHSVNMLLWRMMLQITAKETGHYCLKEKSLPFHPLVKAVLDPLCRWPSAEVKTEGNLRAFWDSVMGSDAPESEFEAWLEFALTSSVAAKPAVEALPELFFAMVYNPHFLLRK